MVDCSVPPPSTYDYIQYKIPHWGIPARGLYATLVCANLEIYKNLRKLPWGIDLGERQETATLKGMAHAILTCCIVCSGYHLPIIFSKIMSVEKNRH